MSPVPGLKVSDKAHELARRTFELTRGRVWSHEPVLRERLQRAVLAVVTHVCRGARSPHQFPVELDAALGVVRELSCTLLLARDLGLLTGSAYAMLEARAAQVERMLAGLRHRLRASGSAPRLRRASGPPRGSRGRGEALHGNGPAQPLAPDARAPLGVG
jgi:four helix bundle protein